MGLPALEVNEKDMFVRFGVMGTTTPSVRATEDAPLISSWNAP